MLSEKSILLNQLKFLDLNNLDIKIINNKKEIYSYINYNQKKELNNIRNYICNLRNWYIYRKIFTPLILLNLCDEKKTNIGIYKNKVLSRSYFKMIEIEKDYNIFKNYKKKDIKVTFIAEAPGGFIESFYMLRNNYKDSYYGISLNKKNKNIPNWNNLKKYNYDRLTLLYGNDNTGDIYKLINILNYITHIGQNSCEIVTADGGFDFSTDYKNQEYNFLKLFFCEILLGLNLQKIGGIFIIKCFDLTHIIGLKLFYLLCHLYESIIITKLKTSRQTNSERYIICKNLKIILNKTIIKKLYEIILKWDNYIIANNKLIDIFDFVMNTNYIKNMELYNKWFFKKQIDIYNIIFSIDLSINKKEIKSLIKQIILKNIKKNILFCKINNLDINIKSYILNNHINIILKKYFNLF
jgi:23S rRNA U2552 (ribose-2'-O)-methylase RlmE/FtsJ